MAIRFACKCGKHLRAGDTMAGRHTLCPKCGALVVIRPVETTTNGAAGPRPPQPASNDTNPPPAQSDDAEEIGPILLRVKRRNDKDPNQFRKSVWVPLDPDRGPPPEKLPRPVRTTRRRYEWKLETAWYQCLTYPIRAWRVLTFLTLAQSCLLVWAGFLIPRISGSAEAVPSLEIASFVVFASLLAAYTIGFFDCVLSSAGAGEYRLVRYPGVDLGVLAALSWLVSFLAGPVLPAAIAFFYWLRCGDPGILDWIIIVELIGAAWIYWLAELLATRESAGWFSDPITVAKVVGRLGLQALPVSAALPVLGYFYGRWLITGLVRFHVNGLFAVPTLVLAQVIAMFGGTFALRVIGLWSYQRRPKDEAEPVSESEERYFARAEKEEE